MAVSDWWSRLTGREQRSRAHASAGGTVLDPKDPNFAELLRGGFASISGRRVDDHAALRVATAWRCVSLISGAVAGLPIDLMRRVDERTRVPAENSPLREILTVRPNKWQTAPEFMRLMMVWLLLRGNAYALKVRTLDRLVGLLPLHPDRMTVEQNDDLSLTYKYRRKDGQVVTLAQTDVLHFRGMSLDGVTGLSVLSYARETFGLALDAETANANLYKNGAFVTGALRHPQKLSEAAYGRLRQSLDTKSGADAAGQSLILEEGMEWQSIGMTAQDAQFLELRLFTAGDVALFFGVPPFLVNATEKATSWGTGLAQQKLAFYQFTLNEHLTALKSALRRDVLPANEPDLYVWFDEKGFMRSDFDTMLKSFAVSIQWGVLSPNDCRALLDLPPRDGGDVYLTPINMTTDPEAAAQQSAAEATNDAAQPA